MRAWRLRALRTGPPRLCLVARTRPDSHVAPAPRAGTATCASVCGYAAGERRARPLLTPPPPAADARGAAAGAASAPGDRAGGTRCSGRASTSIRPPRSDSDVAGQRGATRTSPRGQSGGRSLLRLRRVRDRGRRGATRIPGGRRGAQDWPPTAPTRTAVWLRRAQTRRRAANSPRGRCSGRMQPRGRSTEHGEQTTGADAHAPSPNACRRTRMAAGARGGSAPIRPLSRGCTEGRGSVVPAQAGPAPPFHGPVRASRGFAHGQYKVYHPAFHTGTKH